MGYGAILTGAGTDVSEDHESGRAGLPTLSDVGTTSLFTHRVEGLASHEVLEAEILRSAR
jgi:hypothetical protein